MSEPRFLRLFFIIAMAAFGIHPVFSEEKQDWEMLLTESQSSLRGLHAINKDIAWACGSKGTILLTRDGGGSWFRREVPGLAESEFRSIHAWDSERAIVATAGVPSKILKTIDGGKSWESVYENHSPQAFIDSMRFWNERIGLAFGDPIDGILLILKTEDAGETWKELPQPAIPAVESGEAGFAASNSSLCLFGRQMASIGLGGGSNGPSRIFRSEDQGVHWAVSSVAPIPRGASSGIFSIAFQDDSYGVAIGGDYQKEMLPSHNIAVTSDGGKTWRATSGNTPRGFRSAVVSISIQVSKSERSKSVWVASGPSGCDWSIDGDDWFAMSEVGFHSLFVADDGWLWGCGSNGRIGRMSQSKLGSLLIDK